MGSNPTYPIVNHLPIHTQVQIKANKGINRWSDKPCIGSVANTLSLHLRITYLPCVEKESDFEKLIVGI